MTTDIANLTVAVELSRDELVLLLNALNEAHEALDDWEFSTRMGGEIEAAEQLRRKLDALLHSIP